MDSFNSWTRSHVGGHWMLSKVRRCVVGRCTSRYQSRKRTRGKPTNKIMQHDGGHDRPTIRGAATCLCLEMDDLAVVPVPCLLEIETDGSARGKSTGPCALRHPVAFLVVCDQEIEAAIASILVTAADHERPHADAEVLHHARITPKTTLTSDGDCPMRCLTSRFLSSTKAFPGISYAMWRTSSDNKVSAVMCSS